MRNHSYLLLCALFVLFITPMALSAQSGDSIYILPDVDSILICPGGDLELTAVGGTNHSWTPPADFDDPTAQSVTLSPTASQWYYVTATINDTTSTDSIYVTILPFNPTFEASITVTDTICPLDPVEVTFTSNYPISSVIWSPMAGVEDPESITGTVVRPRETTDYLVTATIANCEIASIFTVNVINFRFELVSPDTIYLCLGDSGTIQHNLFPIGNPVVWDPLDSTMVLVNPATAVVNPTISATYTATSAFEECILTTVTFVRVDSLPDTTITNYTPMDPYCEGDRIALIGESTDILKYPDIMYQWFPMDGQIQDSTNTGNVVIILQDTTEFFRIMNNNGCHDTTSVVINVIPFAVPLSVTDTTLCDGEEFQVLVLDPEVTDIEWTPADGLSCTTCPNPFVMVMNSVTYMMMGMKSGCPVGGQLNVTVPGPLEILIADTSACPGEMIAFNINTSGLSNLQISTTNNAPLSCTDCPNPIVTYLGGVVELIVEADENLEQFCGARGTATISQSPDDEAHFILGGNPPYGQGESAPITLVTIPPASGTTTYSWTVNSDLLPESSATVNAILDEQSNTILVEWINSQGCLQMFDTIIQTGPPGYKIPKAFTPGNTMTNTHFRVQIEGNLELTEMLVFNRWGQVVYDGTDLQGWDGRHDGELAPPGVYAYLIKLRYPDGDVVLEKGDVTLLR